jgi:predicted RNase H-like HicB family nuclease
MKRVFYGAAIQGAKDRKERSQVHEFFIKVIQKQDCTVYTEHTTGKTYEEAIQKLEKAIGPLPKDELQRKIYVRNKIIEAIEGDIKAAIFEVSTPSLGTGMEIAHAYLRPRIGLSLIPVLALYEKDFWPNKLSTMIKGISKETVPQFTLKEYTNLEDGKKIINEFLSGLLC